jgi:hypothetical protein
LCEIDRDIAKKGREDQTLNLTDRGMVKWKLSIQVQMNGGTRSCRDLEDLWCFLILTLILSCCRLKQVEGTESNRQLRGCDKRTIVFLKQKIILQRLILKDKEP